MILFTMMLQEENIKMASFMFFGGEGSVRNHIDIDMSHVFITQFQGIKRIWLIPLGTV
jgi:ribosomal protein L16 Arg81 hydroxylase